jgi:elongation of very long chain fatty acids protein 6
MMDSYHIYHYTSLTRTRLSAHHTHYTSHIYTHTHIHIYTYTYTHKSFEKYYDPMPVLHYMQQHPFIPILTCALYVALIFAGQYYMRHRPRYQWRYTMALWNVVLSTFSGIGMLRTVPPLLHNLYTLSVRDNVCLDPRATYGSGSTGLWVQLFVLSKFPELVDTFFIVIHKKPLIFLHWYHHITVLLYCWHSYVTKSPPGIFFVVMNYSVHAIMYLYYGGMTLRIVPSWFHPAIITTFQISQMVVGVLVTAVAFYYSLTSANCGITTENNTAAFLMYGSYLLLFVQFFLGRYHSKTGVSSKRNSSSTNTANTPKECTHKSQ